MMQSNESNTGELPPLSLSEQDSSFLVAAFETREHLERMVQLNPNPTNGRVTVSGIETMDVKYRLFDDKGNMLTRIEPLENGEFSLGNYPSGTYYVWIYAYNTHVSKKLFRYEYINITISFRDNLGDSLCYLWCFL